MPSDSTDLFGDPISIPTRRCTRCKQIKSLTDFGTQRKRFGNYRKRWCRDCDKAWHREHAKTPHRMKQKYVYNLAKYGLTLDDYDAMLTAQNGVCAICAAPERIQLREERGHRQLSVDHSHVNGQIRGLLCRACNTGIAQFQDNQELLLAAIEYLKTHSDTH